MSGFQINLFNHVELVNERHVRGVYSVLHGIAGFAKIQKIDMSSATSID